MKPANGTVIIARRCRCGTSIYHTDDECRMLDRSERDALRVVDRDTLPADWRECSYCADGEPATESQQGIEHDMSYQEALRKASKEDGEA